MRRLLIVAPGTLATRLAAELGRYGYVSSISQPDEDLSLVKTDGVLVVLDDMPLEEFCRRLKAERQLPVIALLKKLSLNDRLSVLPCDDFVVEPYDAAELNIRLKQLFAAQGLEAGKKVSAEGLVIDTAEAAVYLDGEPVELTFREYELLRYLAEHPGRVFSRDALLNAVWGFDYFGGDRTVDVHIRRLRSKIEDAEHSYIDTVRNMGYRFKKPGK